MTVNFYQPSIRGPETDEPMRLTAANLVGLFYQWEESRIKACSILRSTF